MRPLLVIGAGGLLLWYLNSKGYLTGLFGGTTTTVIPTGTTTPPTTTGTTPTAQTPGFNSLAAIYTRLKADAQAPAGLTAFGWNYSLARVSSITPPDPTPLFAAVGLDASINMTADQYWSVMAPVLTAQFGLSGMRGLGSAHYNQRYGGWAV